MLPCEHCMSENLLVHKGFLRGCPVIILLYIVLRYDLTYEFISDRLVLPTTKGHLMNLTVRTTLDRKYMLLGTVMTDPYTEDLNGALYLVCDNKYKTAILCDAIVSIEEV